MNEKERFAQNFIKFLKQKGIEPRPCVVDREFHLHHYGNDITQQAIRKWLQGESLPNNERLQTLADWLGVELTDLVSEERAYKIKKMKNKQNSKKSLWELLQSNDTDRLTIETFLKLPSEHKKIVQDVIMAIYNK